MRKTTYTKTQIRDACKLFKKGELPVRAIARAVLMDTKAVRYHCDPKYKTRVQKDSLAWRKKHPKRWRTIANRANKKYRDAKA